MAEVGSLVAVLPSDGQWSGIRSIPYHVNPLHCIPYHTIWHRNQVHLTIWYHYQCRTWHHTILTHTILDHMTHTTLGIISDSYLPSTCTMYLAVGTIQVPYLLIPTDTIGAPPSYPESHRHEIIEIKSPKMSDSQIYPSDHIVASNGIFDLQKCFWWVVNIMKQSSWYDKWYDPKHYILVDWQGSVLKDDFASEKYQ